MNKAIITDLERQLRVKEEENWILNTHIEIWKTKSKTWEEAFKSLVSSGKLKQLELKENKPFTLDHLIQEEAKANSFVDDFVMTKVNEKPLSQGEIGVQNVWIAWIGQAILNEIRKQAPIFIAKVLEEIKERAIPYAIQIIEWLLEKLQDYLYTKWIENHDENERETLKNKIIENFPESQLAKRLQNS